MDQESDIYTYGLLRSWQVGIISRWDYFQGYWFHRIWLVFGISLILVAYFHHAPIDALTPFNKHQDDLHSLFAKPQVSVSFYWQYGHCFSSDRKNAYDPCVVHCHSGLFISILIFRFRNWQVSGNDRFFFFLDGCCIMEQKDLCAKKAANRLPFQKYLIFLFCRLCIAGQCFKIEAQGESQGVVKRVLLVAAGNQVAEVQSETLYFKPSPRVKNWRPPLVGSSKKKPPRTANWLLYQYSSPVPMVISLSSSLKPLGASLKELNTPLTGLSSL